jgi:hypothetical protein
VVPFDPLDVPRDQFLVAAETWRACREGRADPRKFGVRDLNGIEGLSSLIDPVPAARTEDELRRLYGTPPLTVPDEITSNTTYDGVRKVTLRRR